ncbi:amino-acid N-acetyltransferase [Ranunculus cassubicifolius]
MGNLYLETTPLPLPDDLKVTMQSFSMVLPSEKTERRTMFLSNIDQILDFNVQTIHFFEANAEFSPDKVVEKIEDALRRLLVPYDFLAGRLKFNPTEARLEIECNAAGIGFAVASSELTLKEIGNLVYPNSAFRELVHGHDVPAPDSDDPPMFVLQVTSFKCGGFAMSISNNHILMDGISFKMFLQNLASLAADKPLAITPYNDRTLLSARSPPQVSFAHPELLELPQVEGQEHNAKLFQVTDENLDVKVYHLSGSDIMRLRKKAKMDISGVEESTIKITSFNVVMAHIWRCKALSGTIENYDPNKVSTILYAVDIRSRLGPPEFPSSYTGNAVINGYGMAKVHEMKEKPFSYLVKMMNEGTSRISDEYVRSVVDWGELHKGFPCGDVLVSSWWKLGFEEVQYPWGRPKYSCPLVHYRKDIILFFPEMDGVVDKGVNVLVALPGPEMKKFQELFDGFLADIA